MPSSTPERKSLQTSLGTVSYRDEGEGTPVLFIHGFLMSGAQRGPTMHLRAVLSPR